MDLGEAVTVDVASENHDSSCYFCNSKEEPIDETNECVDDLPEDDLDNSLGSYEFKNDAGKLGNALGGKPDAKELYIGGNSFDAAVAAHHLIPGNASLKKSKLFLSKKYLWKDGNAKGNIGYNINNEVNGVWSPGNYGVRPWGSGGLAFQAQTGIEPKILAFRAIEKWRTQFHDAHEDYSEFVKNSLNELFNKLKRQEVIWCPEAKKESDNPEEKSPMYVLVSRLNTISLRMKKFLTFPTTNWKSNIFTSRFSKQYMTEKNHKKTQTVKVNRKR
jgi:hypothetical protein